MKRKKKYYMIYINGNRRCSMMLAIINIIFILWVVLSWIDINTANKMPEPVYQVWNFFRIFM